MIRRIGVPAGLDLPHLFSIGNDHHDGDVMKIELGLGITITSFCPTRVEPEKR